MYKLFLCELLLLSGMAAYAQKPSLQGQQKSSLHFVENTGQVTNQYLQARADIDFRMAGKGVNLFVGNAALHYQWAKPIGNKVVDEDTLQEVATYRMDVKLLNANPNATILKEEQQAFYERYYTPQFGAEGGKAHAYQRITYQNIYPNIDWVLYVKNNVVEYDFVVKQGGKVSDIQLQYSGSTNLSINKNGSLTATTPLGSVTEAAPISFQQVDGKAVASSFKLQNNILSFEVGAYEGVLVIDPILEWATYYGGSFDETIPVGCIAADAFGNAYFTGHTKSIQNIATTGSHQNTMSSVDEDAFLVKFNAQGQRLWATYYGGNHIELSAATATDKIGNVYLAGRTGSIQTVNPNFATSGAHQPTLGGGNDAFLVKFDSSGARQWATYYGGTGADQAFGLACDTANNIVMSGLTASTAGIATVGAFQENRAGGNDAFIVKFNPQGLRLWATYFGGTSAEFSPAVAIDEQNNIIIAGHTQSDNNIAGSTAFQTIKLGTRDAFIAKFDSAGFYQWSTYFGAEASETFSSVTTDNANNIYIGGYSANSTTNLASQGSHQATFGGGTSDGVVAKFSSSGTKLWSTYVGGAGADRLNSIKFNKVNQQLYTIGRTASPTNITFGNAIQNVFNGVTDAIVQKFDPAGNLIWSTYYGSEGFDEGMDLAFGASGTIFMGGTTESAAGITTANAHQTTHGGSLSDGFIALINDCDLENNNTITGDDTICQGALYSYTTGMVAGAQSYQWLVPQGWQGNSASNSIDIVAYGSNDSIGLAIVFACGTSDTVYKNINLIPLPALSPNGAIALCDGDTLIINASAANDYQWLENGQMINGATQQNIAISSAGTYQVVSTNSLGCADTSLALSVTLNPLPTPVITVNGNTLSAGLYAAYQWQHNGTNITGATQQDYTFSINSGTYTVEVTDSNGCIASSLPYTAGVGIRPSALDINSIRIYPNPVTEILHIESKAALQLVLSSVDGRKLLQTTASTLDLNALDAGVYILYCYDANGGFVGVKKVVKR